MKPRDRIFSVLSHELPDRIPRFEIWIDAFIEEFGGGDEPSAYVNAGQDCVMMPSRIPEDSNAWKSGVDEFGRVWEDGFFKMGIVDSKEKLLQYSPPIDYVIEFFDQGDVLGASFTCKKPQHTRDTQRKFFVRCMGQGQL